MPLSTTRLRADLYRVMDKVLKTGVPAEIQRKGKLLKIVPVEPEDKLKNLVTHPEYLVGDPQAIVHVDWSSEWRP